MRSNEWDQPARECVQIIADRHSIAAGRDINLELRLDYYTQLLAHRAHDPKARSCYWCKLAGQPPMTDRCLACNDPDIGEERRKREVAEVRRKRWVQRVGDLRFVASFIVALMAVGVLLGTWPRLFGTPRETALGGLVMLVLLCGLFDYGLIGITVWFRYDLPRWLVKHRLGWLVGRYE